MRRLFVTFGAASGGSSALLSMLTDVQRRGPTQYLFGTLGGALGGAIAAILLARLAATDPGLRAPRRLHGALGEVIDGLGAVRKG